VTSNPAQKGTSDHCTRDYCGPGGGDVNAPQLA
jgi:hypothetical protein